jgi:hypothetical protein
MKSRYLAAIIGAIAAAAALALVFAPRSAGTAKVYLDGELVFSVDLDRVEGSRCFSVGEGNTVQAEKGRIRMLDADCPDRLCVDMGWSSSPAKPIVCLPNKVMILIDGRADADAVSG